MTSDATRAALSARLDEWRAAGMTVYVASRTRHAAKWRALRDSGLRVISTWIDEAGAGETSDWPDLWRRCLGEAVKADVFLLYAEAGDVLRGALIEAGARLAWGGSVYYCGPDEAIGSLVQSGRVCALAAAGVPVRRACATCGGPTIGDADVCGPCVGRILSETREAIGDPGPWPPPETCVRAGCSETATHGTAEGGFYCDAHAAGVPVRADPCEPSGECPHEHVTVTRTCYGCGVEVTAAGAPVRAAVDAPMSEVDIPEATVDLTASAPLRAEAALAPPSPSLARGCGDDCACPECAAERGGDDDLNVAFVAAHPHETMRWVAEDCAALRERVAEAEARPYLGGPCPRCLGGGDDPNPDADGEGQPCLVCGGSGDLPTDDDLISLRHMAGTELERAEHRAHVAEARAERLARVVRAEGDAVTLHRDGECETCNRIMAEVDLARAALLPGDLDAAGADRAAETETKETP